jgi:hypothetical protein
MSLTRILSLGAVVWFAAAATAADEPKPAHPLVGTWRCVSAKYGGREVDRPAGSTQLKHVTPAQFMWAVYDAQGKVEAALGGPCTIKGEEYVETPEYGLGDALDQLKGKPQAFTWKVEGTKWHHAGKLSTGLTIEEVWERVEPKK